MELNQTQIIIIITTATIAAVIINLLKLKEIRKLKQDIKNAEMQVRSIEKSMRSLESESIKSKNALENEYYENIKILREKSFQEGFENGITSSEKDHLIELTNIRALHREEIAKREQEAGQRAKEIARIELENQTKAFSVEIRPYIKTETDEGIIRDKHKSHTGYQYQLLVNGIPAFQPHIIIEKSENISKTDKETLAALLQVATKSAKIAAQTYLSGAPSNLLKMGAEIISQVKI